MGILEKKMETTIYCLGSKVLRVWGRACGLVFEVAVCVVEFGVWYLSLALGLGVGLQGSLPTHDPSWSQTLEALPV